MVRAIAMGLMFFCISILLYILARTTAYIWIPQNLGRAQLVGGPPRPDKKRVAQPVQVAHDLRIDRLFPRQRNTDSFGAPADRPAYMQLRIKPGASRQDE